ncbi:RING-type E3 ubiquitin transferase [Malassezia yamatoensis]|uniref:RING-type E3 ubiquitin transferase n=1 Tax=Malassezia yamatoensis TaxID=253288 RepID=A0AAJ5YNH9_9BASI|nr:RING-type E3 ubiquitin transferase [Malassezia yamatoensis]
MSTEEILLLTNAKKSREREKKEMEATNRKHLSNMRVVQKNLVYVVGLSPKFAREEFIATLKSSDYFGQYGKVAKILISKRTSAHKFGNGHEPSIGVYVTYQNKEDAARAIVAIDGSKEPGGRIIRASYGTTKYCTAYLRNLPCSNPGCTYLHEPGEEADSFTKEDLATLRHAAKDTEHKIKPASMHLNPITKKVQAETAAEAAAAAHAGNNGEGSALPRTALWASGKPMHQESRDVLAFPGFVSEKESLSPGRALPMQIPAQSHVSDMSLATPDQDTMQRESNPSSLNTRQEHDETDVPELTGPAMELTETTGSSSSASSYVSSYKPSANAQRLLDDLHARRQDAREQPSIFPDFDWALATLHEGDFSFNLPALSEANANIPTQVSNPSFPASPSVRIHNEEESLVYTPYQGTFNPFDADLDSKVLNRPAAERLWRQQHQQQPSLQQQATPPANSEEDYAQVQQRSAAAALLAARARQLKGTSEPDPRIKQARPELGRPSRADSQSLLVLLRRIQEQPDSRLHESLNGIPGFPASPSRPAGMTPPPPGLATENTNGMRPGGFYDYRASPTPPPPGLGSQSSARSTPTPSSQEPSRATGLLLAQLLGTHGAKTPELA